MSRFFRAGLVLVPFLLSGHPAAALTDDEENDAIVYAWDNAQFTLYHEVGHMLVDLYQLPVLSREEDAVDNLATLLALDDYNKDGDPILTDAAAGWIAAMSGDDYGKYEAGDFFDEHSVNAQRAYTMICLLVGSNEEAFGDVATQFGLSKDRQERCEGEYEQTKRSWDAVLAPHAEPNKGEPKITVVYDDNGKDTQDGADILRDNEVLELVARRIEASYTLPAPVTFRGSDCGVDNAFYNSGNQTVTICYELVQTYYDQYKTGLANGNPPTAPGTIASQAEPEDDTADDASAEGEGSAPAEGEEGAVPPSPLWR